MEQDQHERSLCRRKRMPVNIIEFSLISVTAWGLGFARYLAEHKGVEIMHLFKISRDLSATMTAISAIGFIILVVVTAAVAETSTRRHKILLLLWSLIYSVCTALTSIIWYLGVPPQEHSPEIIPTWKKFCILASFVFQDISLDIVQALLISWIIAREKHTERAIASFGSLYPIGSLVASALFLKIVDVGGIFTIPSFVVPIFVAAMIVKTSKSMDSSSSSNRQKFCINSLHIFCPDTRIKNLQIWR
ncbi:Oidioi.mRNA.OKI2018_I69.XSR.g15751.t2.cds [Oikopleura dioica]|uniref:Oidioi.mRNA.OKI2018_I69.XSR.g15751.t2.cds n=1 Tax=Oikopleura dioica TaxID=34765 RepID=A0ABN7SDU4_OIKDI|nr:Oidioi.mRNA.OKI2018_I69.XSR.g15751.t2.cds [Oikopleura dioica]